MKIALYAHGGSGNHCCEALVRSTMDCLGQENHSFKVLSERPEEDLFYHLDQDTEICGTKDSLSTGLSYLLYLIKMKLCKDERIYYHNIYRKFGDKVGNVDLALAIGGDNYCYKGFLEQFGVQNDILKKKGIPTVLWGCSIDPERINGKMVADLKKYKFITARESITYNALHNAGLKHVFLIPDTAFKLKAKNLPLPEELHGKEFVGINLSPLISGYESQKGITIKSYETLVSSILDTTEYNILLIPHVVWTGNDDRIPLSQLYNKFKDSGRITLLGDHNACEQKGFISRCRFLVAARTHASIAGYSTAVPTLVVGYSVKAKGIAHDLFGTDKNYVIPVSTLQNENSLTDSFNWLMKNETMIRRHYSENLTTYIKQLDQIKELPF